MAPMPLASSSSKLCSLLILCLAFLAAVDRSTAGIFDEIELIWGANRTYFFMDGESEALALSLDQSQGSCFRSREKYLYVQIDVEIKLIEGDSAGTVCTIYVRNLEKKKSFDLDLAVSCIDYCVCTRRPCISADLHASVRLVDQWC